MRFRRAATRRLGPLFIRRLTRTQRWSTLKVWGVAVVEACVGAHHLSRKLGHDARLMPAKYVRPYSKRQKTTSMMRKFRWSREEAIAWRGQVEARFANIPPCLIGMEGCVGAHHLSRKLSFLGHDARLMPAKYVRPYSKRQKNDFHDAEAIAEAVQRPTMRFVATKTSEQLDLQVPEVNSDHEGTARNGTSR
jgi:transposase